MPIFSQNTEDEFWQWFEKNSTALLPRNLSRDPQLQRNLDARVKDLNVPGWEIGPFSQDPDLSFLAYSPMGDKKNSN
jgi:hypothetical protein